MYTGRNTVANGESITVAENETRQAETAEVRIRLDERRNATLPEDVVCPVLDVPPERVLEDVVRDAVAQRDSMGHVWHERMVAGVLDDDAFDQRSPTAISAVVEVQSVPPEHCFLALAGTDVPDLDVRDRLWNVRADHDVGTSGLGSLYHDVASQVQDLWSEG